MSDQDDIRNDAAEDDRNYILRRNEKRDYLRDRDIPHQSECEQKYAVTQTAPSIYRQTIK